jgi:Fe2+ or Zn2+ uptake regulation protein
MEARRNTVQRQLIIDAVRELNIHATAEQVVGYLAEKHPAIGRATVYRNLSQMSEAGELLKIVSHYGSTHYDHNCHSHSHFVCGDCKQVFDIEGDFSDIGNLEIDAKGFDITGFHITFSGKCWDCKTIAKV